MLADLALHVGDLEPAVAEHVDRARELLALLDDVPADLLSRARPRRWRGPAAVAAGRESLAGEGAHDPSSSCPFSAKAALISLASSIAMSGVGGAPRLKARQANSPAAAAISRKRPASTKKPPQKLLKTRSLSSQATPCISIISAARTNTPAARPATDPRSRRLNFSVTSVLASSISSRIRTDARSE